MLLTNIPAVRRTNFFPEKMQKKAAGKMYERTECGEKIKEAENRNTIENEYQ